jgi:hypothetical protein
MYLRNVGFEILRYSIASSVVRTVSLSINDIEFLPFTLIFNHLLSKYRAYQNKELVDLCNHLKLNDFLWFIDFLLEHALFNFVPKALQDKKKLRGPRSGRKNKKEIAGKLDSGKKSMLNNVVFKNRFAFAETAQP